MLMLLVNEQLLYLCHDENLLNIKEVNDWTLSLLKVGQVIILQQHLQSANLLSLQLH